MDPIGRINLANNDRNGQTDWLTAINTGIDPIIKEHFLNIELNDLINDQWRHFLLMFNVFGAKLMFLNIVFFPTILNVQYAILNTEAIS